jgi:hypothetical protein
MLGVGKNRVPRGETQPFRAKSCKCGRGGTRFGRDDEPKPRLESREFVTINLTQAALHLVANDSGANTAGNNCGSLRRGSRASLHGEEAHTNQRAMKAMALRADRCMLVS